jgi:3',5'-cyclic AMP phosphodiesterase CpdA
MQKGRSRSVAISLPMKLTLAHISDVHLGPVRGFAPRHWTLKRGFGYANWRGRRARVHRKEVVARLLEDMDEHAPDHVAVTGDLVNLGLPGEHESALRWLESIGPPDRVSVVPGNHDVYVRLEQDPGIGRWRPYMTCDSWGSRVARASSSFPFVRRVGAAAIIGLCSAVPTPLFVAAGELGSEQLASLGPILDAIRAAGLARIVLIHHPPLPGQVPRRRALEDAAELARVLDAHGAELVLHGHAHRNTVVEHRWRRGVMSVVGVASGSVARTRGFEPFARYNLITIAEGGRTELIGRGLERRNGPIVELERRVLKACVDVSV